MFFDEKRIRSVQDLLRAVEQRRRSRRIPIWYRGLTKSAHKLIPSLGRHPYELQYERALINAFKQNAVQFVGVKIDSDCDDQLSDGLCCYLARRDQLPKLPPLGQSKTV